MVTTRLNWLAPGLVAALTMAASPVAAQVIINGAIFGAPEARPAAADTIVIPVHSITTVDSNGKKIVQIVPAQAAQIKPGQVVLFREEKEAKSGSAGLRIKAAGER